MSASVAECIAEVIAAQNAMSEAHVQFTTAVTRLAVAVTAQGAPDTAPAVEMPPVMDVKEAAALLRISPVTAYKLIYAGKLRTVRVGRRQLVRRESVLELLEFAAETAAA